VGRISMTERHLNADKNEVGPNWGKSQYERFLLKVPPKGCGIPVTSARRTPACKKGKRKTLPISQIRRLRGHKKEFKNALET